MLNKYLAHNLLSSFENVLGLESINDSCKCFNADSQSLFTLNIKPRRKWTSFARE